MKKIRIIKTKILMLSMLFFCVIFSYASCLGVSMSIVANAQSIASNLDGSIKATFNDNADYTNIYIDNWSMTKNDFSVVSTSKIMELESFVKKHTKDKYDLVYVINVAFFEDGGYLEEVNGLEQINFEMNFDGSVVDGYCAVVYLDTHKTQNELMTTYKQSTSLLSGATSDSLTYLASSIVSVEGENKFNLSVDTNKDGVYLIFQIDTTYFNAQNLFLIIGLGIILAIIVLLVLIIIRIVKNKNLAKVQERIRSTGDSYLRHKKGDLELDREEIEKNNLTRKVPKTPPKQTKTQNGPKQMPLIPKSISNKTEQKITPKLPSKTPQLKKQINGEE